MNLILYIIGLCCVISCNDPITTVFNHYNPKLVELEKPLSSKRYKVIGVKDGDTFIVLMNGREQVIRLAHIDCPERKQPFGLKAKQYASDLCFGKSIQLKHNNKLDRYNRLISEVILENGVNVNKELVRSGFAWHFKKYSDNQEYAELEMKARKKQVGIWSNPKPVAPWNWRKYRKIHKPKVTEQAVQSQTTSGPK